jgi:hypothetical protein
MRNTPSRAILLPRQPKGVLIKLAQFALLAAILSLALASAAAQTLTGTVTNVTTSKPAAGDEVTLINLANGMDVAGAAKATRPGKFGSRLASFW